MAFETSQRIEIAEDGLAILSRFRGRLGLYLARHRNHIDEQDADEITLMVDELKQIKAALVALRNEVCQHDNATR